MEQEAALKLVKASQFARDFGFSRRTVSDWCRKDPSLAVKRGRSYWIRLEKVAERPGMDIVAVLTTTERWIKATDLARWAELPRRTVAYWCRTKPRFARRIGRTWYINPDELGATHEQVETLRKWAPNHRTAADFLEFAAHLSEIRERNGQTKEERP